MWKIFSSLQLFKISSHFSPLMINASLKPIFPHILSSYIPPSLLQDTWLPLEPVWAHKKIVYALVCRIFCSYTICIRVDLECFLLVYNMHTACPARFWLIYNIYMGRLGAFSPRIKYLHDPPNSFSAHIQTVHVSLGAFPPLVQFFLAKTVFQDAFF